MAECKTCGAPVNLAPDGDPHYEPPSTARLQQQITNLQVECDTWERSSEEAQSALQEALAREAGKVVDELDPAVDTFRPELAEEIVSLEKAVQDWRYPVSALPTSASPSDTAALIEAGRLAVELTEVGGDWWSWLDTGPARDIAARLHRACAAIIEKEKTDAD